MCVASDRFVRADGAAREEKVCARLCGGAVRCVESNSRARPRGAPRSPSELVEGGTNGPNRPWPGDVVGSGVDSRLHPRPSGSLSARWRSACDFAGGRCLRCDQEEEPRFDRRLRSKERDRELDAGR